MLLLHNISAPWHFFGINPAFWSIAVEFQLYLLYVLLYYGTTKLGWQTIIIACFSVEVGIRIYTAYVLMKDGYIPRALAGIPFGYLFSWFIGAAAAQLCRQATCQWSVSAPYPAALLVTAVISNFIKPLNPFSFLLFSTATAAAIVYIHQRGVAVHATPLASLGLVSYSVYLIHQPILEIISMGLHHSLPPLFTFVLCLSASFPIYWLSKVMWKHIEIPSVNAGYRLLRKLQKMNSMTQNT
jgi:peptidoglycan/LPS O-acetylase OafA/YrhL